MRSYYGKEKDTARRLRAQAELGCQDASQRHEYLGGIDAGSGGLIDYRTDHRPNWVDLGPEIDQHLAKGGAIIVHHNHIGFHSLSGGDWAGLVEKPLLLENWVHCSDGTRYWGKLIPGFEKCVLDYCKMGPQLSLHTQKVEFYTTLYTQSKKFSGQGLDEFLQEIGPHKVNEDMKKRGWVEYEAEFGDCMQPWLDRAKALEARPNMS